MPLVVSPSRRWPVDHVDERVMLETAVSSWARMAQLSDGSWLAAYTIFNTPTIIRVKRSYDNMRSWTRVTDVGEAGRNLDNADLTVRADGTVPLALLSDIPGSFHINVYQSGDAGNSFQFLSQVDWDRGETWRGLYEPYLYVQPDGSILCFYSNETHQAETPAYSQTLSEKVSQGTADRLGDLKYWRSRRPAGRAPEKGISCGSPEPF